MELLGIDQVDDVATARVVVLAPSREDIFDFLALPREIRDMIYEEACDPNDPQNIAKRRKMDVQADVRRCREEASRRGKGWNIFIPARANSQLETLTTPTVLLTNKQISEEAMKYIYNKPLRITEIASRREDDGYCNYRGAELIRSYGEMTCGKVRNAVFCLPKDLVEKWKLWCVLLDQFARAWLRGRLPSRLFRIQGQTLQHSRNQRNGNSYPESMLRRLLTLHSKCATCVTASHPASVQRMIVGTRKPRSFFESTSEVPSARAKLADNSLWQSVLRLSRGGLHFILTSA